MALVISDEDLQRTGLSERDALIEFACRMFQAEKLSLPAAAKLAKLTRVEMEDALFDRRIPAYRYTVEMLEEDMANLKKLGL